MSFINKSCLAEFVGATMAKRNITSYDVQLKSGNTIHQSYVVKIKNGLVANISHVKLAALAKGLDLRVEELINVLHGKNMSKSEVVDAQLKSLLERFERLSEPDKIRASVLIEAISDYIERLAH